MADWNTGRRIAISGAVFGQPSSDRNQSLTYSELYGTGGIDGLFGEIVTQWPEAMTGYGDSREAATSAMIVPIPCGATDDDTDGNESPEEARFNDALYEMELVGHDFFLFHDKETDRPSVVYRRHAYDYGLIRLG